MSVGQTEVEFPENRETDRRHRTNTMRSRRTMKKDKRSQIPCSYHHM